MAAISTIFCDVGGVILTDGWGHESRQRAAQLFQFDWEEFEGKHKPLAAPFDSGQITLDQYLTQTLFYKQRQFSKEQFFQFMKDQSISFPDRLELISAIAASGKYLLATLTNESFELEMFRIQKFSLGDYFQLYFASCFLGCRKPGREIYQNALCIAKNRDAGECVFIDDREGNLVVPRQLGMHTVHCTGTDQLATALIELGVAVVELDQIGSPTI